MPIRSVVCSALLLVAPLTAGCYQSATPLGAVADSTIDPALIGTWDCVDPKDATNRAIMTSRRLNAHQYDIEWLEPPAHVTRYRVHATKVGAETLLNVQEIDPAHPKPTFAFLRARVAADRTLTMAVVDEDRVKPHTGADALRVITSRVADPALYGPFATCSPLPAGAK